MDEYIGAGMSNKTAAALGASGPKPRRTRERDEPIIKIPDCCQGASTRRHGGDGSGNAKYRPPYAKVVIKSSRRSGQNSISP